MRFARAFPMPRLRQLNLAVLTAPSFVAPLVFPFLRNVATMFRASYW